MTYEEAKRVIESLGKTFSCGYVKSKTGRSVQRWIVECDGEKVYYTKFQFEKLYSETVRASQKEEETVKYQVKNSLIAKIHQIAKYETVAYDHLINLSVLELKAMIKEPKDSDPILDEEELLLETIKDINLQITRTTKKLQDHHKDKAHYLNRLKVYRQGKIGKDPEQEEAERALIKRFEKEVSRSSFVLTEETTAVFCFTNEVRGYIEIIVETPLFNVLNSSEAINEVLSPCLKAYPEAKIDIEIKP